MTMQVVKLSRKILKPDTPTPPTLRHQKLGFIDEYAPFVNVIITVFFSVNRDNNPKFLAKLETSLEKTLTLFKPFAGRYVEETRTIDCSDQGAEFILATVNIKLQDLLGSLLGSEMNIKFIDEFQPCKARPTDKATDPLLSIQVTTFECGSVALGLSLSHKIADASTMSTFLVEWAAMSREDSEYKYNGSGFNSFSLFPSRGLPSFDFRMDDNSISDDVLSNKFITLKFSFTDNMITNLKEKVVLNGGSQKCSKVQLLSALIAKGLIGVDRALHDYPRDSIVLQPINLREKTASLIPKDSCGNICGMIVTECKTRETIEELAKILSDSTKKTLNNYSKIDHAECQTMVLNSLTHVEKFTPMENVIIISSWCRFPFYEADFGFGKPVWVSGWSIPMKNVAYLMDGVGGNGVEAYVCLDVKDVPHFKKAFSY